MCAASVKPDTPAAARPRRSLSSKLLCLTVAVILLTEILVFVPGLSRERRHWLAEKFTDAHIAALSVTAAPDGLVDLATRKELLRFSGALEIRLHEPGRDSLVLQSDPPVIAASTVDLRHENAFAAMRRAVAGLMRDRDRLVRFTAETPFTPGATVEIVLNERSLDDTLRRYGRNFLGLALLIAGVTGTFVYAAALLLLVRPIRRLTGSLVHQAAQIERR